MLQIRIDYITWCYGFHHKTSFYIDAWLLSSNFSVIHIRLHMVVKTYLLPCLLLFIMFQIGSENGRFQGPRPLPLHSNTGAVVYHASAINYFIA